MLFLLELESHRQHLMSTEGRIYSSTQQCKTLALASSEQSVSESCRGGECLQCFILLRGEDRKTHPDRVSVKDPDAHGASTCLDGRAEPWPARPEGRGR